MHPNTRVTHQPKVVLEPWNQSLVAPAWTSVKYTTDTVEQTEAIFRGESQGFFYSRIGNPTVQQLEGLLCELQGTESGVSFGSGLAAVSATFLSLLKSGDHIILFAESYKPTRLAARDLLSRFNIRHSLVHIDDLEGLESLLASIPTRLVMFETPTNPCLAIADIDRITALARKYGALVVLDNTFAGFHNHHHPGIDLYIHSLTKYACGHGDAMGGVVLGKAAVVREVRAMAMHIAACLDPQAAWMILRGMKTYFLRYERQCHNAARIADFLKDHPQVSNLRYPGLVGHPGHDLARRQMKDFGGIITFDLKNGNLPPNAFVNRLTVFRLAASLGSTESLVAPALLFFAGDLPGETTAKAGISPSTVRLSIGIEDAADLIQDLENGLAGTAL